MAVDIAAIDGVGLVEPEVAKVSFGGAPLGTFEEEALNFLP